MTLTLGDFTIRPYEPGDEDAILASFNVVFREVCGDDFVDREMAFWRWEFEQVPAGHRIWVAVTKDGVVASHYGGVAYPIATHEGEFNFVHIVDSYTHPDYRKGLKRPGLFVHTGERWLEDCKARGDATVYGYPVQMAMRVGKRFLGYTPIRTVDYLCRDLASVPPAAPEDVSVALVSDIPAEADDLFAAVAADKACLTRRDARYLHWRYVMVPGDDYEIYEARRDGRLCGLMVLRPVHELIPAACTIADWLVPEGDEDTCAALVATAVARGRDRGRGVVMAVFPPDSAEHRALAARGFAVVPSADYLERILTHIPMDHPIVTTEWLAEHWWYTLGDSDLI